MFAHVGSKSLAAVLAAATLFTVSGQSLAANNCGPHDAIIKALSDKYKESRRVMGVVNASAVMEMFLSPKGTWTMLVTDTHGTSCILATGQDWQDVPVELAGLES